MTLMAKPLATCTTFFINEVEKPFLEVVMTKVNGNQSRAADILGINRNTLRKKLKTYNLG